MSYPESSPAPTTQPIHPTGRPYSQALQRVPGKWRGLCALVFFVVSLVIVSVIFRALADLLVPDMADVSGFTGVILFAVNNLALVSMWPLAVVSQRLFFGVGARFMYSVEGRFRWKWFRLLAVLLLPPFVAYAAVLSLFASLTPSASFLVALLGLLIVVGTTPLQAAAEEFGLRGLVQRSIGSWFSNPLAALLVSTVLSAGVFAVLHFASDPWLITYYFSVGVAMSLSAHFTGGLEAPIAQHAINNVLLLVPSAVAGKLSIFERSAGSGGPWLIGSSLFMVSLALLSGWYAQKRHLRTLEPRPE